VKLGDPLPSFDGASRWLDGPVDPSLLDSRPVLVHFWSTSCPLCHEGVRDIARWRERFPDLVVVAVFQPRADEPYDPTSVERDARESMDIAYPCAIDAQDALARRFDSAYSPGYYVFDEEHRLRHRQMGNARLDVIEALLERLVVKASPERGAY
jgi:thiol-disulfide isomerase/thioredoxin